MTDAVTDSPESRDQPPPPAGPSGLFLAAMAASFVALIHVAWWFFADTLVVHGNFFDGDSYARLVRVERLYATGGWFDSTLPRFDVLAQLARVPEGLSMGDLSRRLMVSNGNVTDVMARLEKDGLVRRTPSPADRRTVKARLTGVGQKAFQEMAEPHEAWVAAMFSPLSREELATLIALMDRLRASLEQPGGPGRARSGGEIPAERPRAP